MIDRNKFHAFQIKESNGRRYFFTYRLDENGLRGIEINPAFYWKSKGSTGFSLHFGNRSSETPVDFSCSLFRLAFYLHLSWPGLGMLCEKLGRGHKRNLSLSFHGGGMWWQLWYDDDGGYDQHHRCDGWRKPKLWPWSMGRDKHRGWMCLRDGNIDLNPLDAIWGNRYYERETIDTIETVVNIGEFPDDFYTVEFTLQKMSRARKYGPSWVRHRTEEGYSVDWKCKGGIPVRNHEWKGDTVLASSVKVATNGDDWLCEATENLIKDMKEDRLHYNYVPNLG